MSANVVSTSLEALHAMGKENCLVLLEGHKPLLLFIGAMLVEIEVRSLTLDRGTTAAGSLAV